MGYTNIVPGFHYSVNLDGTVPPHFFSSLCELPHGAGLDGDFYVTYSPERIMGDHSWRTLVINSAFHNMNEDGYYVGWIQFEVRVFIGDAAGNHIDIEADMGHNQDREDLEEHLFQVFEDWYTTNFLPAMARKEAI
jgi:hypothetical protein